MLVSFFLQCLGSIGSKEASFSIQCSSTLKFLEVSDLKLHRRVPSWDNSICQSSVGM